MMQSTADISIVVLHIIVKFHYIPLLQHSPKNFQNTLCTEARSQIWSFISILYHIVEWPKLAQSRLSKKVFCFFGFTGSHPSVLTLYLQQLAFIISNTLYYAEIFSTLQLLFCLQQLCYLGQFSFYLQQLLEIYQ